MDEILLKVSTKVISQLDTLSASLNRIAEALEKLVKKLSEEDDETV